MDDGRASHLLPWRIDEENKEEKEEVKDNDEEDKEENKEEVNIHLFSDEFSHSPFLVLDERSTSSPRRFAVCTARPSTLDRPNRKIFS